METMQIRSQYMIQKIVISLLRQSNKTDDIFLKLNTSAVINELPTKA